MITVIQQTIDGGGNVTDVQYPVYSTLFPNGSFLVNPSGMAALIAANVPSTQWTITGTQEIPIVSQLATSDYNAQLQAYQIQACQAMGVSVFDYIEQRYPQRVQMSFAFLYSVGIAQNQPTLVALIQSAWAWTVTVIQGMYWYEQQVMSCTTIPQVDAVMFNLQSYNTTDPVVTLEAALNIMGQQIPLAPPTT